MAPLVKEDTNEVNKTRKLHTKYANKSNMHVLKNAEDMIIRIELNTKVKTHYTHKQHEGREHCKQVFGKCCSINNVQCTGGNCAVSFFFQVIFCCNITSKENLIQIEDERDFTPLGKN